MAANSGNGAPDVNSILKKVMFRLLGQRQISRQETCHLINNLPLVRCSHQFITVNLKNDLHRIDAAEEGKQEVRIMSTVDAYGRRLDRDLWNRFEVDAKNVDLRNMPLNKFVGHFKVGERGKLKNKIRQHDKKKMVAKFVPQVSHNAVGDQLVEYHKYSLAKYRPWTGEFSNAWGGPEASNDEIKGLWEAFVEKLLATDQPIPDMLSREIRASKLARILRKSGNKNPMDSDKSDSEDDWDDEQQDDWMAAGGIPPPADINLGGVDCMDTTSTSIVWDRQYDRSVLQHEQSYADNFRDIFPVTFRKMCKTQTGGHHTQEDVERSALNEEQNIIHDMIEEACTVTDLPEDEHGRLFILRGVGGTGKSHTLKALLTTLRNKHGFTENDYLILATTGKAATIIQGSTVHSAGDGLSLPVKNNSFCELKGKRLADFQKRLKTRKLVVIDEYSMLRPKELYYIHKRLQQSHGNLLPFGGCTIVLIGDPGQFPAVASKFLLWDENATGDDGQGTNIYNMFDRGFKLTHNNRVDPNDEDAMWFISYLDCLRDGLCTEDDWKKVKTTCSQDSMSPAEWDRRGFNDPDCVHLFCTNKEVAEHNKKRLLAQREPIVLIEAKHNNFAASRKSSDLFWGLETTLFLCVGAHISLTINLCSKANLVNGATGVVKDIVYAEDKKPPDLPILVMVDFGEAYNGPSFFPDDIEKRGWVPIPTFTARFSKYNKDQVRIDYTREMMPMKLAWAWTIWKAQGQTFNYKVVANLGKDEKEHGLTYVAMSRVTSLKLFGIAGGLTLDRLTSKILKQKRMVQRKLGEMKLDRIGKECLDRYKNRLRRRGNDN